MNSLLVGVYKFWRSQAPYDKAPMAVDSRMLPSVVAASDSRANVGMWATTFFLTILGCNVMGLMPFNEAPTSGLGFATGLGIATWATATALGFYKLGFTFPGHFIPGKLSFICEARLSFIQWVQPGLLAEADFPKSALRSFSGWQVARLGPWLSFLCPWRPSHIRSGLCPWEFGCGLTCWQDTRCCTF